MIIDTHVHMTVAKPGADQFTDDPLASVEGILRNMDRNGIDKAVVFAFNSKTENQLLLANLTRPYRDRLIPYAFMNPHDTDAADKLRYYIDELGIKGVKMHPRFDNFFIHDIELLRPIMQVCNERRLHIVMHCTSDDCRMHPFHVEALAKEFPQATIQIAHMGEFFNSTEAIEVAIRQPNVYLDTACTSFNAVRKAIRKVPGKLLMGCDYPFNQFEMELAKIRLAASQTENGMEVLDGILGNNFAKLNHFL